MRGRYGTPSAHQELLGLASERVDVVSKRDAILQRACCPRLTEYLCVHASCPVRMRRNVLRRHTTGTIRARRWQVRQTQVRTYLLLTCGKNGGGSRRWGGLGQVQAAFLCTVQSSPGMRQVRGADLSEHAHVWLFGALGRSRHFMETEGGALLCGRECEGVHSGGPIALGSTGLPPHSTVAHAFACPV